jgi:ornithine cyclodeaminase
MPIPTPRIVSADTLRATIGFEHLVEPVAQAFAESSGGRAQNGLIVMFPAASPDLGDVYVKTGVLTGHRLHIVKVSPWFAANAERGQPQGGFMAALDSETGHTLALLNEEHYLSDIRTAAAGAVAARFLAPRIARTAAVLGAGVQAYWQPLALYRERRFERLLIWARDAEKAEALHKRLAPALPGVAIEIAAEAEQAVRAADVVMTATAARAPILRGEWLRPGQHITAVGADDPQKCELDAAALGRARVFVDSVETTLANGDVAAAIRDGGYAAHRLAGEIGDVIAGRIPGRSADSDITIAKFVGIGAQDLVATETALSLLESAA